MKKVIEKIVEVHVGGTTFIVKCRSHYMANLWNPSWSGNTFLLYLKDTGKCVSCVGDKNYIRRQMLIIADKIHLFI